MIIVLIVCIASLFSLLWLNGIDYMKSNHPDYKGDDFLNDNL